MLLQVLGRTRPRQLGALCLGLARPRAGRGRVGCMTTGDDGEGRLQLPFQQGAGRARGFKIGLFPGSFNPPHMGHVDLARRARSAVGLDHVLFYANSFNLAKRDQLAPASHRRAMLELMIDPSCMSVVPDAFYPDLPEDAWRAGAFSFLPLVERLKASWPANYELWMLRGADYFSTPNDHAAIYPPELWHLPHVVGTRGQNPETLNLHMLDRHVCVDTLPLSSSALRSQVPGRMGSRGLDEPVAAYVERHALYRDAVS